MIDNAATIAKMKDAGLSAETILVALGCIVLCAPAVERVFAVDEQAERRRAADRERKRLRNSAEFCGKSAEEGAKEIPPTPPKENTTNLAVVSNTPPVSPPSQDHPRFAEFWETYPNRAKGDHRKPSSKAFSAACRRADPEIVLDGVRRFRAMIEAAGESESEFIPMARTWLNQDRWNAEYKLPTRTSKPSIQDGFAKVRAVIAEVERREAEAGGTGSEEDAFGLPRLRQIGS